MRKKILIIYFILSIVGCNYNNKRKVILSNGLTIVVENLPDSLLRVSAGSTLHIRRDPVFGSWTIDDSGLFLGDTSITNLGITVQYRVGTLQ